MEELKAKIKVWQKALKSFGDLLATDFGVLKDVLTEKLVDGIKNGQIQKFEYCSEQTWKMIKKFLREVDGIETNSPKAAIKEFFTKGYANEQMYQQLLQMIDDRNLLSHLYEEKDFEIIHQRLSQYEALMQNMLNIILLKLEA